MNRVETRRAVIFPERPLQRISEETPRSRENPGPGSRQNLSYAT